jgi:hypothetical protein
MVKVQPELALRETTVSNPIVSHQNGMRRGSRIRDHLRNSQQNNPFESVDYLVTKKMNTRNWMINLKWC